MRHSMRYVYFDPYYDRMYLSKNLIDEDTVVAIMEGELFGTRFIGRDGFGNFFERLVYIGEL